MHRSIDERLYPGHQGVILVLIIAVINPYIVISVLHLSLRDLSMSSRTLQISAAVLSATSSVQTAETTGQSSVLQVYE